MTLKMEAWACASVQGEEEGEGEGDVAVVGARNPLAAAVERLTARLQRLLNEFSLPRQFPKQAVRKLAST